MKKITGKKFFQLIYHYKIVYFCIKNYLVKLTRFDNSSPTKSIFTDKGKTPQFLFDFLVIECKIFKVYLFFYKIAIIKE